MSVIGFVFRLASLLVLASAIFAGVLDAIQSVSASQPIMTSLGNAWLGLDPASLEATRIAYDRYLEGRLGAGPFKSLLEMPAFAVLLVLSLLLWAIGYRRPRKPSLVTR